MAFIATTHYIHSSVSNYIWNKIEVESHSKLAFKSALELISFQSE